MPLHDFLPEPSTWWEQCQWGNADGAAHDFARMKTVTVVCWSRLHGVCKRTIEPLRSVAVDTREKGSQQRCDKQQGDGVKLWTGACSPWLRVGLNNVLYRSASSQEYSNFHVIQWQFLALQANELIASATKPKSQTLSYQHCWDYSPIIRTIAEMVGGCNFLSSSLTLLYSRM